MDLDKDITKDADKSSVIGFMKNQFHKSVEREKYLEAAENLAQKIKGEGSWEECIAKLRQQAQRAIDYDDWDTHEWFLDIADAVIDLKVEDNKSP